MVLALLDAWRARRALALPNSARKAIARTVGLVATGPFYRNGQCAQNQMNWNADVLMSDALINHRLASVTRYRTLLLRFATGMVAPASATGTTNVTPGGALHYVPAKPAEEPINSVGVAEYANLVRSALGWYGIARGQGMAPLPRWAERRLARWSAQVVLGTWTHTGYLNWDTGLAAHRKHLRQYWAFALDALIRGSRRGGLGATTEVRRLSAATADGAVLLFERSAWDGDGDPPVATSLMPAAPWRNSWRAASAICSSPRASTPR